MYNGQNNQNPVNPQYGSSSNNYQYNGNNGMINQPQYGNMPTQGYQGAQNNPQYTYPQTNQGYPQYQQPQQSVPPTSATNSFNGYQVPSSPKKNKKKLIIVFLILILLVVGIVVAILVIGNGNKDKSSGSSSSSDKTELTLTEVMNQYGNNVEVQLSSYLEENSSVPEKNLILEAAKIDGYEIVCETVQFNSSGKAYLGNCSINDSEETYSYGEYLDEAATLKEYGNRALLYAADYEKANGSLPTAIDINYDATIDCNTVKIYDSLNIYLNECSVNGSDKKYSYGYPKESNTIYISYTGYNYDIVGETTTAIYEADELNNKAINCSTNNCSLDKYLGSYVAIKESDGRTIIYNIQTSKILFTVANNLKYTFLEQNGTEVYGLLLKNQKDQEALYSFAENQIKEDYGKYYYDWVPSSLLAGEWGKYPSIETKSSLLPVRKDLKGKYGLLSLNSNTELLPFEYDSIVIDNQYINVTKNNKRGLIDLDGKKVLLGGNFYDEFAIADYQDLYVMAYGDNALQIINIEGKLIKKVAEIPSGYVLMKEDGYSSFSYKEEDGKAIFTILFKTDKVGNPCAKYTYNLTNSTLNIDEDRCEAYKN